MTAPDLHVLNGPAPLDGLTDDEWRRVVEHVRACFPYSRPWPAETQQAYYDELRRFDFGELIGAVSELARTPRRDRERPGLAELVTAAGSERAAVQRSRDEARLRVVEQPWNGWQGVPLDPPSPEDGPYYRLAYAMSAGEVPEHDPAARDAFLASHGLRKFPPPMRFRGR